MQRTFNTVVAWLRSLFDHSWLEFGHYLLFLPAGVAGLYQASVVWIIAVAGAVSLSSRTDWGRLIGEAHEVEAAWRDLAHVTWTHSPALALWYFLRSFDQVPLVIGTVLAPHLLWSALAYLAGMGTGWLWDVGPFAAAP